MLCSEAPKRNHLRSPLATLSLSCFALECELADWALLPVPRFWSAAVYMMPNDSKYS